MGKKRCGREESRKGCHPLSRGNARITDPSPKKFSERGFRRRKASCREHRFSGTEVRGQYKNPSIFEEINRALAYLFVSVDASAIRRTRIERLRIELRL